MSQEVVSKSHLMRNGRVAGLRQMLTYPCMLRFPDRPDALPLSLIWNFETTSGTYLKNASNDLSSRYHRPILLISFRNHIMILKGSREQAMINVHISRQPVSVMTAVNFGELKMSRNPAETLVAFSIGSGIGVAIYDPITKSGGLLNFVLPDSSILSSSKAQIQPLMFADTGLAALFDALHDFGAQRENFKVVLAGGAQIIDQTAEFNIGHKNHQAVTCLLKAEHLTIQYADIGGICLRTLRLDIRTGDTTIQTPGQTEVTV